MGWMVLSFWNMADVGIASSGYPIPEIQAFAPPPSKKKSTLGIKIKNGETLNFTLETGKRLILDGKIPKEAWEPKTWLLELDAMHKKDPSIGTRTQNVRLKLYLI